MIDTMTPDNAEEFSLEDICERCLVNARQVISLVEYGVIEPSGKQVSEWRFTSSSYLRIRKALRIQQDLSINESGVALVIELLDRLESANREIEFLRKQLQRCQSG